MNGRDETSKDTQKLPQESKPTHHSREQERRLAIFRTGNNITKQKTFPKQLKKQLPCQFLT